MIKRKRQVTEDPEARERRVGGLKRLEAWVTADPDCRRMWSRGPERERVWYVQMFAGNRTAGLSFYDDPSTLNEQVVDSGLRDLARILNG